MFNIVLVEPEIPQNTGNIARTCAVTGAVLHLVRPLGFDISDKAVKRAGLDYWNLLDIRVYRNIRHFFEVNGDENIWLMTTKAPRRYTDVKFTDGCYSGARRAVSTTTYAKNTPTAACASPCGATRAA